MKITKSQLKHIIQEELTILVNEGDYDSPIKLPPIHIKATPFSALEKAKKIYNAFDDLPLTTVTNPKQIERQVQAVAADIKALINELKYLSGIEIEPGHEYGDPNNPLPPSPKPGDPGTERRLPFSSEN